MIPGSSSVGAEGFNVSPLVQLMMQHLQATGKTFPQPNPALRTTQPIGTKTPEQPQTSPPGTRTTEPIGQQPEHPTMNGDIPLPNDPHNTSDPMAAAMKALGAPPSLDGSNAGPFGMSQGFEGAMRQPTTAWEGINRANTPGAMEASPVAQLVSALLMPFLRGKTL